MRARSLTQAAGAALIGGAVAVVVGLSLPRWGSPDGVALLWLALALAMLGAGALVGRWSDRRPDRALVIPVIACELLGATATVVEPTAIYPLCFLLVFGWTGLALPRGRAAVLAPFALLAYLLPYVSDTPDVTVTDGLAVVAVSTLAGEVLASLSARVRRAESGDARRLDAMQVLVEGSMRISSLGSPHAAADEFCALAARLTGGRQAALQLGDETLGRWPAGSRLVSGPSTISVPVTGGAGLAAVRGTLLVLLDPGAELDEFTQSLLTSVAAQAGLTLDQLAVTQDLRASLTVDPLTGVGNRRAMEAELQALVPGDLVVVLDLDHFKKVNDTLGHASGDAVLRSLGAFLRGTIREDDAVSRLGGEEFVVIARGAGELPEATTAFLRRLGVPWVSRKPVTSFSAGAAVHRDGEDGASTLHRADIALYEAKGGGRSRGVSDAGLVVPFVPEALEAIPAQGPRAARRAPGLRPGAGSGPTGAAPPPVPVRRRR